MEDRELVERIRAGDRYAFNLLVWKWEKPIYNLALRLLGSEEDAAEVCQEVFMRAYAHICDFRGDARFSTWIYRIAVNCCHNVLRRRKRQREIAHPVVREGWLVDHVDPEQWAHQEQMMGIILNALQQLPEDQRVVVELRVFHERSVEEVAQILGVPEGTVKSRLFYALKRLREVLQPLLTQSDERGATPWLARGSTNTPMKS